MDDNKNFALYLNESGDVLFRHANPCMQKGDIVRYHGKKYIIIEKCLDMDVVGTIAYKCVEIGTNI